MQIRWLIKRDLPEVLDIERLSFEHAWSEDDFLDVLRQRNCIGMVAEDQERIVGYMIYALHKDDLEVLNFAVNPACWRCGIGSAMVGKLINKLHSGRRHTIQLCCREKNLDAQLFFRKCGFRCDAIVHGMYGESKEDAYHFRYTLRDITNPFAATNRIAEYITQDKAEE